MQLRMTDISVFDCPKLLIENLSAKMHIIVVPFEDNEEITVPLSLSGVASYFPTRKPALQEV